MKKITSVVLTALLAINSLYAQNSRGHKCATSEYNKMQMQKNASFAAEFESVNRLAREHADNGNFNKVNAVITIPVVFHVVYNTTAENISDSRLMDQLAALNRDYRLLNTDTANIPAAFKGLKADIEIEFCLANIAPDGSPTTGITRTQTSKAEFDYSTDDVKFNSTGGKDIWDRSKYMNVWVCDLGTALLGYAQFPGGQASTDGVVLHYEYTGTTGASAPYNKGRTGTHEVGHWLGLIHTFESGCNGGTTASTCGSSGDLVCDTPPTADINGNYGCPGAMNTCTESPTDQNDMTMNYMDYVDDACMYLFTAGQKTRIRSVLSGSRASLASSTKCKQLTNYLYNGFTSPLPGSGWSTNGPDTTRTWKRVTTAGVGDNNSMKMDNFSNPDITGQVDHLIAPSVTLTAGLTNASLNFDVAYSQYNSGSKDSLFVSYSTDNGNTWVYSSYKKGGAGLATTSITGSAFTPSSTQWRNDSLNINSLVGNNVIFRFTNKSGWGNNVYLDNISVDALNGVKNEKIRLYGDGVLVYPNPANDVVYIRIADKKEAQLTITNDMGQVVYQSAEMKSNYEIATDKYSNGLYLIKVTTSEGTMVKKLSVSR